MTNLRIIFCLMYLGITTFNGFAQSKNSKSESNTISFEKTRYGLIFTTLQVKDKKVKAMIDFGDQHQLQLSFSLVEQLNIETQKAGYQVSDVNGNVWDVYKGVISEFVVGSWHEKDVEFTSQEGEMEAVSEQIGTEFNAVLGWGYFKQFYTEIDYANSSMILHQNTDFLSSDGLQIPFSKNANQLIISVKVKGEEHKLMIDTGSPVTVVDTEFSKKLDNDLLKFKLDQQTVELQTYTQDLSVLADLEVVGILGGDFLQLWQIVIDPVKSVLHFYKVKQP